LQIQSEDSNIEMEEKIEKKKERNLHKYYRKLKLLFNRFLLQLVSGD